MRTKLLAQNRQQLVNPYTLRRLEVSRRRKDEDPPENHERWLVSYADFITLMFAFFVVMFATSQSDQVKTRAVANAVERALKDEKFSSKVMSVLAGHEDTKKTDGSV